MRILITGAAGFIGSNLADVLSEQSGIEIIGIDNFDPFYDRKVKEGNLKDLKAKSNFQFSACDICDVDAIDAIFKNNKIDVVIHLAAKAGVRPSMDHPLDYVRVNVQGTTNMLEAMRKHGVKKMVFASSSSVYGANEKVPFNENDSLEKIISVYAATKLSCEKMNKVYSDVYGFSILNLRFFTVYGERQRPDLAIHKFFKSMLHNEPITVYGEGDSSRDYTYVKDIVSGIESAMKYVMQQEGCYEIINIGNHSPVNLLELISHIEKVTGRKALLEYKPMPIGDVPRTYADVSKAHKLLNYTPSTNIADGLGRFYQWYQKNH